MDLIQPIIILLLILGNGFLSMSEMALVSAKKVRLENRAEEGDERARTALKLSNNPGRMLSTVQIGITLVGVLTGAFGGATIAEGLSVWLESIGLSVEYSETISVAIIVVITTFLTLVLGELAPKQIALLHPEKIAISVAPTMRVLSRITSPLVRLLEISTGTLLRLMGIRASNEPSVTEEDVRLLVEQGTQLGVFEPIEDKIVNKVFRLSDQRVSSLSTPRTEITWLDLDDSPEITLQKIQQSNVSHLPVARGDLDRLSGYVRATDLLSQCLEQSSTTLDIESALQAPILVPEHMPAYSVLERFRMTGAEIAFTLNEYGGVEGVVTLRDILEALVGDLPEPEDFKDPDVVEREDGSFLIDGMLSVDEFRGIFDLGTLPGEEENYYQTLGGFVLTTLGRIPRPGDHFEYEGLTIEVVDMDGNRIDKLLIIPVEPD